MWVNTWLTQVYKTQVRLCHPPEAWGTRNTSASLLGTQCSPPQGPASHILLRPTCPQREPGQGPAAGSLTQELRIWLSDVTAPCRETHSFSHKTLFAHGKTSGQAASAGRAHCGPRDRGASSPHLGPASPFRTARVSRSRGGWFSHGPVLGDPDTPIQPPGGGELTCAEKNPHEPYRAPDLLRPVFAVSPDHANHGVLLAEPDPS